SSLYTLLFASAASSGMCFQSDDPPTAMYHYNIHGVVVIWVVAIPKLVYVVGPPGVRFPLMYGQNFQPFLQLPEKALDYLVVNAFKGMINRAA
ncbi:hypothetical protein B0H14DRAFT_2896482, partial [Mycena olivaceomarginata]